MLSETILKLPIVRIGSAEPLRFRGFGSGQSGLRITLEYLGAHSGVESRSIGKQGVDLNETLVAADEVEN